MIKIVSARPNRLALGFALRREMGSAADEPCAAPTATCEHLLRLSSLIHDLENGASLAAERRNSSICILHPLMSRRVPGVRGLRKGWDRALCAAPEVPRSGRAGSARMSSNTIRKAKLLSARAASSCSPIRHRSWRGLKKINYANKQACRDCPIRSRA